MTGTKHAPRRAVPVVLAAATLGGCLLTTDLEGFTTPDDAVALDATPDAAPDVVAEQDAGTDAAPAPDAPPVIPDAATKSYRDEVLADAPLAYWPFDDAVASQAALDVVSNRTSPIAGNVVFGAAGIAGTAATFAGSARVVVGDVLELLGEQPYTLEAWVRFDPGNARYYDFFEKRTTLDSQSQGYVAYIDRRGSDVWVGLEQNWGASARGVHELIPSGARRWVHLVFTFERPAGMRVYIDGVRHGGYDADGGPVDTQQPLSLGSGFKGDLDELAIYDHALTEARVAAHIALALR